MNTFQPRKLYVPALIIVTIVLSLLVFIGFSTYWNLHHARANALKFLNQRGVATMEIVETGIHSLWGTCATRERSIDQLLKKAGESEYVAYIYMVNQDYRFLHRSNAAPTEIPGVWLNNTSAMDQAISRINVLPDGTKVYEVAKKIRPLKLLRFNQDRVFSDYNNGIMVIGLNMAPYETARQQDFHHAMVMLSILAILGGGAVFFLFVIHLYHRMNQRLGENQEYIRQVVDSMATGLLSIDGDGRVLSYNNLSLEFLGLSRSEIEDLDLKKVIDFDASGISETLGQARNIMDREISIGHPDGEHLPLAVSVSPILSSEGDCQGAVIILRDLREIKRLEERVSRSEKLAALGKLSATVAHEIRNPLSSIRGFAKFLSHALQDRPKDREYADVMVKEVDRINRVVTDLLNFARPLELEPETVNPAELIKHTVRLVEGDAKSRNIKIRTETSQSPATAFLDPYQITHVLLNLMLNALQAMDNGQAMTAGVKQEDDSANILFWVEDEGPGIPEEHIGNIFDPFFTKREKGTGLGLALVQKIVENHRGRIKVVTPLPGKDRGCRFVISIPLNLEERL